jgi:hypothetical protein
MENLIKERKSLEKRLLEINKEIEKQETKTKLIESIHLKAKEVQNKLTEDLLIKVHHLEDTNELLITEYFEEDYVAFPYFDEEYEIILYRQKFDNLYDTLTMLNKIIKEAKILKNKLKLSKILRTEHKYDFHKLTIDHIMQITHKDFILATLPESFNTELYTFICFNENNTLDLAVTTRIKYSHDINISTEKFINGIEFNVKYEDYSDCPSKTETFRCTINKVKIEDVSEILHRVKIATFSNSSLVKLTSNYSTKYDWEP